MRYNYVDHLITLSGVLGIAYAMISLFRMLFHLEIMESFAAIAPVNFLVSE